MVRMDLQRHLAAVTRSVEADTRDGQPVQVVVATRSYPTSPADLWGAITDPGRIARWFAPVSGELRQGGRYQVEGNAGGEILECVPRERFLLTWEFEGTSWVEVSLDGDEDETTLTLRHSAPDSDHWQTYGPGSVGVGWELGLLGLAEHISTGAGVTPEDFEGWAASEDGRTYLTESATTWGEAAAAAGDDPEHARQAATRTAAFFRGDEPA